MTETLAVTDRRQPVRGTAFGGAFVLFSGQVAGQALSFARNLIVARMISAADFGIASTFAIAMSLLEMLGDLSLDKMIVQASDGDSPTVQATAQFLQFVRGAVSGLLLFCLAGVLSSLFDAPEARWAFQVLALVPVINGLAHLDVRRFQRESRFGPGTVVETGSQLVATLAVWPLALWLGDYSVVLYSVLLQAAASTIVSHALADRRYAWSRDREVTRRIATFGWPLMVNAILMFAIFQGDRVAVGTAYSHEELGAYSLAFSITFVPTAMLAKIATPLSLPVLSRVQHDTAEFERRMRNTSQAIALAAALLTIPLVLAGAALIVWIYGSKYSAAASVMPWLAAMQGVRILRISPTLAALARADTVNPMLSNVVRSCAIGGMAAAAALHADLQWIAIAGLVGEVLAFLYSARRLRRKFAMPWATTLAPSALTFAGASAALAAAAALSAFEGVLPSLLALATILIATVAGLLVAFPELRATVREFANGGLGALRGRTGSPRT